MVLDVAAQKTVEVGHLLDVLELVEGDQRAVAAALLEPQRQVEQRVQGGSGSAFGSSWMRALIPATPSESPIPVRCRNWSTRAADRALQVPRVGALEPHRDVGQRDDPVEVDEHRHQPLLPLAVSERALEQARLAVLARRVEPHVVAPDGVDEQLAGLALAVDDVVRRERMGVDERVDVGDHLRLTDYQCGRP